MEWNIKKYVLNQFYKHVSSDKYSYNFDFSVNSVNSSSAACLLLKSYKTFKLTLRKKSQTATPSSHKIV